LAHGDPNHRLDIVIVFRIRYYCEIGDCDQLALF